MPTRPPKKTETTFSAAAGPSTAGGSANQHALSPTWFLFHRSKLNVVESISDSQPH